MADSKKYDGSQWEHSLRKLGSATDIITTLPADIYANDTTATVGLKGNMSQTGTPTSTTPIQPSETGERTGNLLLYPYFDGDGNYNGVNIEVGIDGKIVGSGQTTAGTNFSLAYKNMKLLAGTYTLSVYGVHTGFTLFIRDTLEGINIAQIAPSNDDRSATFTLQEDTSEQVSIYFNTGRVDVDVSLSCYVMLNKGQPMDFEPYGYKIPISSAGQTTPIYLGEVETTRKVKKYECTGEENWRFYSDSTGEYGAWQFYVDNVVNGLPFSSALSNIAEYGATESTRSRYPYGVYLVTSGTGIAFQMAGAKDTFTGITAWKSYLAQQYAAGTPVTVWYVLEAEETGIVNEPLRKIGDYADTVSGVSIPTIAGADSFDVQTTLKPSEVSLTYTGWHDATVKEWDGSEWQ